MTYSYPKSIFTHWYRANHPGTNLAEATKAATPEALGHFVGLYGPQLNNYESREVLKRRWMAIYRL